MTRAWILAVVIAACGGEHPASAPPPVASPPSPPPPAAKAAAAQTIGKTAMMGDIAIADGAITLVDGGIEGVQGHTLTIPATGDVTWARRIDSLQPSGKPGSGTLALTASEQTQLQAWRESLWALAPTGKASYFAPPQDGPPRWVWAIVQRRGGEVRVVEGGSISPPTGAPPEAVPALAWLVTRVDAAGR